MIVSSASETGKDQEVILPAITDLWARQRQELLDQLLRADPLNRDAILDTYDRGIANMLRREARR